MIYIGNHVSFSKGFLAMGQHEKTLGGNTFAFFTRNPRGGKTNPADPEDLRNLRIFLRYGSDDPGADMRSVTRTKEMMLR